MRRLVLLFVLTAVIVLCVAPAPLLKAEQSDVPPTWEQWALRWQARMENAWGPYSVAYLCLADGASCTGPDVWTDEDELTDEEWAAHGRLMRELTFRYERRFKLQWHRMTHPRANGVSAWRPLAEWVCHFDVAGDNNEADARALLRQLEREYGSRPHLVAPHATLRRINRQWFADHKHAPGGGIIVDVEGV